MFGVRQILDWTGDGSPPVVAFVLYLVIYYLSQCNVASIGQRRDDKTRRVAQIFVIVQELCVANICVTVVQIYIPTVPEMRLQTKLPTTWY